VWTGEVTATGTRSWEPVHSPRVCRAIPAALRSMAESTAAELLERALSLPTEDRLALGKELLKSVDRQDEQQWADAWLAELDRRAESAERGDEPLESWEDVEARILADLHSK
jgi:putative addiction module component (TIGR02574 family)